MPFEYLTSIPTGRYVRLDNAASEAAAPNTSACGRFTVDTDVKKTQSFFPRVMTSFRNAMRRLGLIRPLPSTDPATQSAHAIYKEFRKWEKAFRMMHVAKFPEAFSGPEFKNVNVSSLHKAFSKKIDRRFSQFADILRATKADNSALDLPAALCKAYKRMVYDVLKELSSDTVPYKAAMMEPMLALFEWLKLSITPSTNSSPPAPVAAAAAAEPVEPIRFEKDGIVCSEFAKMRRDILLQEIEAFKPDLIKVALSMDNLRGTLGYFKSFYANFFNEILDTCPSTISMEDLLEVHREAADLAVFGASPHKDRPGTIPVDSVEHIAGRLSAMRKYINRRVDVESKSLPNRPAPLAPLHPRTGRPEGDFFRMKAALESSGSGNGGKMPAAPQVSVVRETYLSDTNEPAPPAKSNAEMAEELLRHLSDNPQTTFQNRSE